MSIIQAIVIGLIQGLTEFIPVSSTAHMTIYARLSNLVDPNNPEHWTACMAVVQLGTLAAVLLYFAADIRSIVTQFLTENLRNRKPLSQQSDDARMGWYVIIGSLPLFVIGYVLKKVIEGNLTKNLHLIAMTLVAVSAVIIVAERLGRRQRQLADLRLRDAILIGLSQCFALIPGTSRSGATISAGLFLGMTRESAARFSFLLSIPAVAASGIYEFLKAAKMLSTNDLVSVAIATMVAAASGYLSIALFLRYLRTHSMTVFVVYRVLLAVAIYATMW